MDREDPGGRLGAYARRALDAAVPRSRATLFAGRFREVDVQAMEEGKQRLPLEDFGS